MATKEVTMGRPAVPASKRLDQRVPVMLRESEKQLIKKKATKEGMTVSEWCRKALVEAAGGSID
jgi:hypothetical protein